MGKDCGLDLFWDFEFDDITRARPPDAKGVYVIRVRKPGMPPDEIIRNLRPHISRLGWEMAEEYLLDRIGRIEKIGDCPIIYIGSAGPNPGSRITLAGRYRDLVSRHTIQFPIWALLYFGWELDLGWKVDENPKELEKDLKGEIRDPPAPDPSGPRCEMIPCWIRKNDAADRIRARDLKNIPGDGAPTFAKTLCVWRLNGRPAGGSAPERRGWRCSG